MRLVRESKTQMGKGFGYVSFVEAGAVEAALALHGSKFRERELRVFRYSGAKGQSAAAAGGTVRIGVWQCGGERRVSLLHTRGRL